MYQELEVQEEFMDMVLQASLINSISDSDNGSLGGDKAFKLLNSAKELSPEFQAKVVNKVGVESFIKMVPNMTNEKDDFAG